MTSSKVMTPRRQLVVAAVLLYGWFFYIDPLLEEDQLGPEELEGYREELGAWVRDNEERLRQVTQILKSEQCYLLETWRLTGMQQILLQ